MIFRSSKNNYQNYKIEELYTNEYVENVNGKSNWNSQEEIEANDPKEYELDNAFIPVVFITNGTEYTVEDCVIKEPNKTTTHYFTLNNLFDENYRQYNSQIVHLNSKNTKTNTFKFEVKKGNKEANDSDGGNIKPYIRYYETEKGVVTEKGKYLPEIKVTYDSTFELVLDKTLRIYQISFYSNDDDSIFDGGIPKDLFCGSVYVHTCYCNRDFTEYEVQKMVMELRKKDDVHTEPQFEVIDGKVGNKLYINKDGKVIPSTDRGKRPEEAVDVYRKEFNAFDKEGTTIFDFQLDEKIEESDADIKTFTNVLNKVLKDYKINTCIRKIHFLAQSYHETQRFHLSYEAKPNSSVKGGAFYRGRGLIQLTHNYNYEKFYKLINKTNTNPTKEALDLFVPRVAKEMELAVTASAYYWNNIGSKQGNISQFADKDDVLTVSKEINGYVEIPNGYDERVEYTNTMKKILEYDGCIKK